MMGRIFRIRTFKMPCNLVLKGFNDLNAPLQGDKESI